MEIVSLRNVHARDRPKKLRIGEKKRWRYAPVFHKLLGPIKVREHKLQQLGALNNPGFDQSPLVCRDQQRYEIESPGTIRAEGIAVNVVSNAILPDAPLSPHPALREFFGTDCLKRLDQASPVRPRLYAVCGQLIIDRRISQGSLKEIRNHEADAAQFRRFSPDPGQRRSKVIGKLGLSSSSGTTIGPGVWPLSWNRSERRLSASAALTGRALYVRPPGCRT